MLSEKHGATVTDDIERWKREIQYLRTELMVLESGRSGHADLSVPGQWVNLTAHKIAELKKKIAGLERRVAGLQKRKNA